LVRVKAGAAAATGVEVDDGGDSTVGGPRGAMPVAMAALTMGTPASTSDWVTTYDALQVVVAPGASVVTGQSTGSRPARGSTTATPVIVVLPVLVTRNE
jgi:hypothetical protein